MVSFRTCCFTKISPCKKCFPCVMALWRVGLISSSKKKFPKNVRKAFSVFPTLGVVFSGLGPTAPGLRVQIRVTAGTYIILSVFTRTTFYHVEKATPTMSSSGVIWSSSSSASSCIICIFVLALFCVSFVVLLHNLTSS